MEEYKGILIHFLIVIILVIVLVLISLLSPKTLDLEKTSAYECGFEPFPDTRSISQVRYYLLGLLFSIFDPEIAFLSPHALVIGIRGIQGLSVVGFSVFISTIGSIFEYLVNALDRI